MLRFVILLTTFLLGGMLSRPVWGADSTIVINGSLSGDTVATKPDSGMISQSVENTGANEAQPENPFITPKKTALYSAILPGLGQVYNHQYWKVPVIYAGLGVAAYFIKDNLENYNTFRKIAAGRASGDPAAFQMYPEYSDQVVLQARDYYRKNLDLTVLLTAVGYTLQIIDAVVFAHLKTFDISSDITFHATPIVLPHNGVGFGLVVNF